MLASFFYNTLCVLLLFPFFASSEEFLQLIKDQSEFDTYFSHYEFSKNSIETVSEKKCRIWLVRHGESESNAAINDKDKIRIAGRTINSPLSEKGKLQADKLAFLLKNNFQKIDAYYTSPLSRAVDTAVRIQERMEDAGSSKRITCLETLLETDYGFLEGANGYTYDPYETEMKKNLPLLGSFEERMNYRMVSDMESNQEVFLRIHSLVNDIAQQHFGETVCLLTHNGPLKAMFMHLAAYDFGVDVMYHIFSVGNCAALCLESDGKSIELKRFYNISMRK